MISDEELLFYHYGDGLSEREHETIRAALAGDPELAERHRRLVSEWQLLANPSSPRPGADAKDRWMNALNDAAATNASSGQQRRRRYQPLLAMAATLLVGVLIGIAVMSTQVGPEARVVEATMVDADVSKPNAYLRLASAELGRLGRSNPAIRATLVNEIVARNRLYVRAAETADELSLARALRAFEPILLEIGQSAPGSASGVDASQRLAFELRVLQTKFADDTSNTITTL